jgi:hypothetical protein
MCYLFDNSEKKSHDAMGLRGKQEESVQCNVPEEARPLKANNLVVPEVAAGCSPEKEVAYQAGSQYFYQSDSKESERKRSRELEEKRSTSRLSSRRSSERKKERIEQLQDEQERLKAANSNLKTENRSIRDAIQAVKTVQSNAPSSAASNNPPLSHSAIANRLSPMTSPYRVRLPQHSGSSTLLQNILQLNQQVHTCGETMLQAGQRSNPLLSRIYDALQQPNIEDQNLQQDRIQLSLPAILSSGSETQDPRPAEVLQLSQFIHSGTHRQKPTQNIRPEEVHDHISQLVGAPHLQRPQQGFPTQAVLDSFLLSQRSGLSSVGTSKESLYSLPRPRANGRRMEKEETRVVPSTDTVIPIADS